MLRFQYAWMKSIWMAGNNVLVNWKRTTIISRVRTVSWGLSVGLPESCCNEKNTPDFRASGQPVLSCPRMGGQGRQRGGMFRCDGKDLVRSKSSFPGFQAGVCQQGRKGCASFRRLLSSQGTRPEYHHQDMESGKRQEGGKASGMVSSLLSNGTCCGSYALYYFESRREA